MKNFENDQDEEEITHVIPEDDMDQEKQDQKEISQWL